MPILLLTVGLKDKITCLKFEWDNEIKARDNLKLMTSTHPQSSILEINAIF